MTYIGGDPFVVVFDITLSFSMSYEVENFVKKKRTIREKNNPINIKKVLVIT